MADSLTGNTYQVFELTGAFLQSPYFYIVQDAPAIILVCSNQRIITASLRLRGTYVGSVRMLARVENKDVLFNSLERPLERGKDDIAFGTTLPDKQPYSVFDLMPIHRYLTSEPNLMLAFYTDAIKNERQTVSKFAMPVRPVGVSNACGLR